MRFSERIIDNDFGKTTRVYLCENLSEIKSNCATNVDGN